MIETFHEFISLEHCQSAKGSTSTLAAEEAEMGGGNF